jgi:D-psicose/D-tagatose/L-ribulose 3-epimerase
MKIGIHLSLWTDNPTMQEQGPLLEQLKTWGADGVEFPIARMSEREILDFARLLDDLDMGRTAGLVLNAAQADPANQAAALRQAAVDEIRRALDRARNLGADMIAGPLFQGLGRFSGAPPTTGEWLWAVETIRTAGQYAADMNMRIALEPLNRFEMYMINTVADGAKFVRAVALDNVGLLVDTHHALMEENNTAEAWQAVINNIFHVHISESHRSTPGTGQALSPEIFTMLKNSSYDDWLTIEAFGQRVPERIPRLHLWRKFPDSEDEIAQKGLKYLRKAMSG